MATEKKMTVKMLRESLAQLGSGHDDREVQIWLPGSRIVLGTTLLPGRSAAVLIEGNVMPGSALDEFAEPKDRAEFRKMIEIEARTK